MKYLTITVPCYNSEAYMRRCIDSLLAGGRMVEIIIVNDGSTDRTGEIADEYASRYPDTVFALHKENGGHGSGVNAGLACASGRYFKVVDSDDWLKERAYRRLLKEIAQRENDSPDLFVCDYSYCHPDENDRKRMGYRNIFPAGRICRWEDTGHFRLTQYLIMHALVFRTDILRKSKTVLPEHTFYVDNLFACRPLPFVETICYLPADLYQYCLGRSDQSVNEQVLIARIEQQIKVTELVADSTDLDAVKKAHPKLARYLYRNVSIMMAISSVHLLLKGDEAAVARHRRLWRDLKNRHPYLYRRLRFRTLCGLTNLPGPAGRWLSVAGFRAAKRIYRFQ